MSAWKEFKNSPAGPLWAFAGVLIGLLSIIYFMSVRVEHRFGKVCYEIKSDICDTLRDRGDTLLFNHCISGKVYINPPEYREIGCRND